MCAGTASFSPTQEHPTTRAVPAVANAPGVAMGGWFVAIAFGNNLSGFFGGIQSLMDPMYFFLLLAGLSALVALFILAVI